MSEMITASEELKPYLAAYESLEKSLGANGKSWTADLRRAAIARFTELGFPTLKNEEWRYTNVAAIKKQTFKPAGRGLGNLTARELADLTYPGLECTQLVFVNGHYSGELSTIRPLPQGVTVSSLANALSTSRDLLTPHLGRYASFDDHPFAALNTALFEDGAFISIPKGAVVGEPIHLLFVSTAPDGPIMSHPRILILAGENSQSTILEDHVSLADDVYLNNVLTEIVAEQNAVIGHYKIQRESFSAFHMTNMQVELADGCNFSSQSISLGGALVRNNANAVLDGEGIEATLNGLFVVTGKQHVDNHTLFDHAKPHCTSHQLYKGVLGGNGHGVFNGKILVRKDAQKTDGYQSNKNLLLSDNATMNTKPQLEIYADDVKCSHGATIGQLQEEAVFYLRSRGIDFHSACHLLVHAFANDVIERIKIEPVRARLEKELFDRLTLEKGFKEVVCKVPVK